MLEGIKLNVGPQIVTKWKQIVTEWKDFYCGHVKNLFLPSLINELYNQDQVPKNEEDTYLECDLSFNSVKVKNSKGHSNNNSKVGVEGRLAGPK